MLLKAHLYNLGLLVAKALALVRLSAHFKTIVKNTYSLMWNVGKKIFWL